ncbi:hypothetical protein PENTCL1PPCAC_13002 [Pristionchus entomophagus]|uniref:Uncharacterized protein n=1 Tax=Pristionchus entomophagus TaxID=358040 RepID=A0AAV5T8Y5_9BILA|nr:hypothetical protein PENTCL1PPCAC_13002 [Pristionchus entomophagus]
MYMIIVCQKRNGNFYLNADSRNINIPCFCLSMNSSGVVIRERYELNSEPRLLREGNRKRSARSSIPSTIIRGIKSCVERFDCKRITFRSVLVDDIFMSRISPILSTNDNLIIGFDNTVSEDKYDDYRPRSNFQYTEKFLKWLVSLKAKRLELSELPIHLTAESCAKLLRDLANYSQDSELQILLE